MDYDALERLVRLRDQGALSNDEFVKQKHILLTTSQKDSGAALGVNERFFALSMLRKVSAIAFAIGLCAVLYSTFVYDITISPLDLESNRSTAEGVIREVVDRYERTMAGERIINFPRVEMQRRIFSFGALLMVLGTIGFVAPFGREQR